MSELNTQAEVQSDAAIVAAPLTRREKLLVQYNTAFAKHAELATKLQELAAEINGIDLLASITVGHAVIVSVGKNGQARDEAGVIIAVKEEEDGGKTYKVQYGSGFDTDIAVVKAGKLKLPPAAPQAEPESSAE
ncbi:MAG TPA: hypothetical protein VM783_17965 [Candidatus Acidoferrum sp.]|nr:hypothetical protein [Candidatus Acidoferrum sp.]